VASERQTTLQAPGNLQAPNKTSKPSRYPYRSGPADELATLPLMFCAAGAAVATSSRPETDPHPSAAVHGIEQAANGRYRRRSARNIDEVERAKAAATASALREIDRATRSAPQRRRKKPCRRGQRGQNAPRSRTAGDLPITNP